MTGGALLHTSDRSRMSGYSALPSLHAAFPLADSHSQSGKGHRLFLDLIRTEMRELFENVTMTTWRPRHISVEAVTSLLQSFKTSRNFKTANVDPPPSQIVKSVTQTLHRRR